jgi:hypothetical protein
MDYMCHHVASQFKGAAISRLGYVALGRCNNGDLSGIHVPGSSHTGASNGGSLERSAALHGVDDTVGAWHTVTSRPATTRPLLCVCVCWHVLPQQVDRRVCASHEQ